MCETCGNWTCSECGYHHYSLLDQHAYVPECDRCGCYGKRVTYQEIDEGPPDAAYIDEYGKYWHARSIVNNLQINGIPFSAPSTEWMQFYAVQA